MDHAIKIILEQPALILQQKNHVMIHIIAGGRLIIGKIRVKVEIVLLQLGGREHIQMFQEVF